MLGDLFGEEGFEGWPVAEGAFVAHFGELGGSALASADLFVWDTLVTPGYDVAQLWLKDKQTLDA